MDNIRDNPVPAAMVGIGLGWLFLNGRRDHDHYATYRAGYVGEEWNPGYYGGVRRTGTDAWGTARERQVEFGYEGAAGDRGMSDRASNLKENAMDRGEEMADRAANMRDRAMEEGEELKDRVQDRVTGIAHDARDMVGDVRDRAREMVSSGRDRSRHMADDLGRETRNRAHHMEDRFEDTLRDNPLAVGAAAMAIGLAVGLSAPSTRRESELMGGARDRLVERAKDEAHDVADRARHVAHRVADEAKSTAKEAAREENFR